VESDLLCGRIATSPLALACETGFSRAGLARAAGAPDLRHKSETYDVAVVGLGPSGLIAGLALARLGADVAAIGLPPSPSNGSPLETRTAALLTSSVDLLKNLEVWPLLAPHAAPLEAIRIIDASRSLFRAPDIEFRAEELGLSAFGYNVPNSVLVDALHTRAQAVLPSLLPADVTEIAIAADKAILRTGTGGSLAARLIAGADGRHSICRRSAGIGASERRYGQAAIAASFGHALPHNNVSIELHQETGSVTTVPLPDRCSSSLIWLGTVEEIGRLMRLDADGFGEALSARLDGLLGAVGAIGARSEFRVVGLFADRMAARRTALIGEAAHILPPIGAQGLNLSFRDAAALADCVADALGQRPDPGGDDVLEAYRQSRSLDVLTRTLGIDFMSRALLSSFPPLQAARGLAMQGLKALPPLRRAVMRVGLAPPMKLPSLMRPGAD
jgi:2-octaprenyl-6-methoxyphenol hydroxylase